MLEGETPSSGEGEGAGAPANEVNDQSIVDNSGGAVEGEPQKEGGEADAEAEETGLDIDITDKRAIKSRFTTLTAQRDEALAAAREAEIAAAKALGRAEALEKNGAVEKPKPTQKADPNPEPNPADKAKYPLGRDDPQYIEDRAVWRVRRETEATQAEEARQTAAKADFNERRDNYLRAVDAAKANADTPNAAKQLGEMSPAITDLIAVSDQAALIAEHLHSNPAEYKALAKHIGEDGRLTSKGLAEVSRKIGSFEATLPGAFAAKKVTKSGAPPETAAGGGRAAAGNDPYKRVLSSEEYRVWRQSQNAGA